MTQIKELMQPAGDSPENREVRGTLRVLVAIISVVYVLFHIYTAGFGSFAPLIQRSIHVGFALVLAFMLYSSHAPQGKRPSFIDWMFAIISIAGTAWVVISIDRFTARLDIRPIDIVLGIMTILVIMEAARRVIGLSFTLLAAVALAYALLGQFLPMPFTHRGFGITVVVNHLYTADMGLWGITTGVSANVVAIFIIFGSVLFFAGGGESFIKLALFLSRGTTGGPAKMATISSMLFGAISGSAAANAAVTGSFSIPMMKRQGYDKSFAAAVEATASTGGQLMPPIMGTAAFIMAEMLNVPYAHVMQAALIPALLMYGGLLFAIHFKSKKEGYAALEPDAVPKAREVFSPRSIIPLFVPVVVLLWVLFSGSTPERAGFWATVSAIGLFFVTNLKSETIWSKIQRLFVAIERAGYALVMIAVLAATAQILIGIIGLTGIGVRFTVMLIAVSGGILLPALIIAMGVALILGMGMPTAGAYLIASSVLAPALSRIGIEPIQAHLFIFYFATLSAITPPVCAAVFVASGIAQSEWLRTAFVAMRMGLVAFIVPYMFVYSSALLLDDTLPNVLFAILTASVGVTALAGSTMGYFLRPNKLWETACLFVGAMLMIWHGPVTDSIGFALVISVAGLQLVRTRKRETRRC